ncbi:hypothetical protein B296_00031861 [Ensete ventricosum]|uniref:Uncharacterized protein n=1 Tax=Ensete ventricosum TaxID=4639 RepID=A0A426XLR2_ENSVE|nr:hypothetical protein B296_00031861 [Ensete ventricosum]
MFGNLINKGRSEEEGEGEGEGEGKADKLNPVVPLTRLAHGAPPTQLSLPSFRPPRLVPPFPPRGDGPFIRPRGPSQPSTVDVHASGGPEADALRDRHASAHLAPTVRVHREGRHVGRVPALGCAADRAVLPALPSVRRGQSYAADVAGITWWASLSSTFRCHVDVLAWAVAASAELGRALSSSDYALTLRF